MATTSILASRSWTRVDESELASDNHNVVSLEESLPVEGSGSESLLKFLQVASEACVGVATDLEPVHHLETLGEGLSFSVKVHLRKQSGNYVLKVFKHGLVAGQNATFDQTRFRALMMEAYVLGWKSIHDHENIVTMTEIALAIRSSNPLQISPALILERAPHGTLSSFQQAVPKSRADWTMRKTLCYDVAAGVKALHECGIVHGDLKAENVLVFDHPTRVYVAKLSDFGSAVILPNNLAKREKVRLAAYTPPWNAPEATEYMTADQLPKTDVYSLGLLIWRILVHRDPFLFFDLPLDPATRLQQKRRILATTNIAGLIPCFIEQEVGFLGADEILLLAQIFAHTVTKNPDLRSLDRVIKLLQRHSRRSSAVKPRETSLASKLESLNDRLTLVPSHLDWFRRFHHLVQSQILLALEDFCGFGPIRHGQLPIPRLGTPKVLREGAIWAVFQCHLIGIGTNPNPSLALDILYYAGLPEYGSYWKSFILTKRLYDAFDIAVPKSRASKVATMGLNTITATDINRTTVLEAPTVQDTAAVLHGIFTTAEELTLINTTIRGNDSLETASVKVGDGNTLLHVAAFYNVPTLARFLLDHRLVDINAANDRAETALLIACKQNSYDVLDLLLKNGAEASTVDTNGENCLFWLISFPPTLRNDLAGRLVAKGASLMWTDRATEHIEFAKPIDPEFLFNGRVRGGPLLQAIAYNDIDLVKCLLELCMVSLYNSNEDAVVRSLGLFQVPILLASQLHLHEILEHLCAHLLQVLRQRYGNSEPTIIGDILYHFTKSSVILRDAILMTNHVHRLCYHGQAWKEAAKRTMNVLHNYGFVTTRIAAFGYTEGTLNFAIASGSYEIVEELLSHQHFVSKIDDADPEARTTPFHKALDARRLDVAQLLVRKGATVDLRTRKDPTHSLSGVGASYLHVIASLRLEDNAFAELVLSQGVPANIKDNRGLDAFGLAMSRCSFDLARLLIERGYSLHETGIFGVSVLGDRFIKQMAQQHDDIYESVKFILSYDGPAGKSLFIVDRVNMQSVLHIAVAFPLSDETRYRELLALLLSHFCEPWQINLRTGTASKSTPLQMAIAMRNPVAVNALIEAGANLELPDVGGATAMELARSTIAKLLGMDAASKPQNPEKELKAAFETLSVLASKKSWPDEFQLNHQAKKALEVAKPLLDRMMLHSHQENYLLGHETQAMQLVTSQFTTMPSTLDGMEDFRREVNSIIEPCLYAEICAYISPSTDWAVHQRKSYPAVRDRIPWCKSLTDARLSSFQQAAAFEWCLEEVRKQGTTERGQAKPHGLAHFAQTHNPADLPIDHRFVRWPPTLLDWYVRAIQEDEMELTDNEQAEVEDYVQTLRSRAAARTRGSYLPPFPPGFIDLHFNQLQPDELIFETTYIATMLLYRCRCFREKITPWTVNLVEFNSQSADEYRDYFGANLTDAVYAAKDRDLSRRTRKSRFKSGIGIQEGEGQIETSGLNRGNIEVEKKDNLAHLMLQRLMTEMGVNDLAMAREILLSVLAEDGDELGIFEDVLRAGQPPQSFEPGEDEIGNLTEATERLNVLDSEGSDDESGVPYPSRSRPASVSEPSPRGYSNFSFADDSNIPPKPLPSINTPPELPIESEPHVAAALATYLFHCHVDDIKDDVSREAKFAFLHMRDYDRDELWEMAWGTKEREEEELAKKQAEDALQEKKGNYLTK